MIEGKQQQITPSPFQAVASLTWYKGMAWEMDTLNNAHIILNTCPPHWREQFWDELANKEISFDYNAILVDGEEQESHYFQH